MGDVEQQRSAIAGRSAGEDGREPGVVARVEGLQAVQRPQDPPVGLDGVVDRRQGEGSAGANAVAQVLGAGAPGPRPAAEDVVERLIVGHGAIIRPADTLACRAAGRPAG